MKALLRRMALGLVCVLMIAQGADMVLRPQRYAKGQREQYRETESKARTLQLILWLGADKFGAPATGFALGSAAMVGLVFVCKGRQPRDARERNE
jgi:hypothetical protein